MYPSFNPGHVGLRMDLQSSIAAAARLGFRGVDFSIAEACAFGDGHGVAAFLDEVTRAGLKMGNWGLPFAPCGEVKAWEEGVEKLGAYAVFAKEVGALRTTMWIAPGSNERAFDANFEFHVERFKPISDVLRAHDIRLGLEFIGPALSRGSLKHEFVYTMTGMLELCGAIGPNVGLLLDSWHLYTSGGTADDLSTLTDEQVVHVHINDAPSGIARDEQIDNRRKLPGTTGVIDMVSFLQGLTRIGYEGPVAAEPFDQETNALPEEERLAKLADTTLGAFAKAGIAISK